MVCFQQLVSQQYAIQMHQCQLNWVTLVFHSQECLDLTFSWFRGLATFPLLPSTQEEEDEEDEGIPENMRETAQEKEEKKTDQDVARQDVVKVRIGSGFPPGDEAELSRVLIGSLHLPHTYVYLERCMEIYLSKICWRVCESFYLIFADLKGEPSSYICTLTLSPLLRSRVCWGWKSSRGCATFWRWSDLLPQWFRTSWRSWHDSVATPPLLPPRYGLEPTKLPPRVCLPRWLPLLWVCVSLHRCSTVPAWWRCCCLSSFPRLGPRLPQLRLRPFTDSRCPPPWSCWESWARPADTPAPDWWVLAPASKGVLVLFWGSKS